MKNYSINNLRNVGLIGHGAVGKTSLAEALLFYSGNSDRLGKVEDGTTVTDFDPEEKRRGISLSMALAPINFEETKINLIDIPGYFDFAGELIQGMRAVDTATIVVCGVSGIQVGTEKAWEYCNKIKLPRTFFINKLDRETANFDKILLNLKETFGISVVPIQYPIGVGADFKGVINIISKKARIYNSKTYQMDIGEIPEDLLEKVDECKRMLTESVAETDEVLLDKYFSEGELSDSEIYQGLIKGCANGDIATVMCGSSTKVIGMECMLEDIVECFPSPEYAIPQKAIIKDKNEEVFISLDEDKPFSALVFKTIADPFVGKISLFRVITGKLNNETIAVNSNKEKTEKLSHIFTLKGKTQISATEVIAGDIAAVSKLQYTETGDTLCDINNQIIFDKMNFPSSVISMAVKPKVNGEEDKVALALVKLLEEDPTFIVEKNIENAETIISGQGEIHLEIIASKLKNKFAAEVVLQTPKVPYRETIKSKSDVQGKHKKQSGGHGQYGDVKIKFEPRADRSEELEFVDKVVGGAVPRNFIPAVEKALQDCILHGVIGGYPVIGLKATLYDGSYHAVDSSEMAFKMATSIAYKKGLENAKPILLEPIMNVEVIMPDEYMGDVIGDINKRRGRVLGMDSEGSGQKVIAEVPLAEMFKYSTDLRSMTQARGIFISKIDRYEEVPETELKKIMVEK